MCIVKNCLQENGYQPKVAYSFGKEIILKHKQLEVWERSTDLDPSVLCLAFKGRFKKKKIFTADDLNHLLDI